jgi:hypothetical protein
MTGVRSGLGSTSKEEQCLDPLRRIDSILPWWVIIVGRCGRRPGDTAGFPPPLLRSPAAFARFGRDSRPWTRVDGRRDEIGGDFASGDATAVVGATDAPPSKVSERRRNSAVGRRRPRVHTR